MRLQSTYKFFTGVERVFLRSIKKLVGLIRMLLPDQKVPSQLRDEYEVTRFFDREMGCSR